MLEIVAKGFRAAKDALGGKTVLTEENIQGALRDIRICLLEADVDTSVARSFLAQVKARAVGEVVAREVKKGGRRLKASPADHFVAICHEELVRLMGPLEAQPILFRRPLTTIMLVGLQGTGKTTTCGKLAAHLQKAGRRPLLVAADLARPAAIQQLQVLGERMGVPVFHQPNTEVAQLCVAAKAHAHNIRCDVVIFDTAGRLAIDAPLMQQLVEVRDQTRPDNIFLVCDAMSGQDAVHTAAAFHRQLSVTGFIITKLDGDARGGAALSLRQVCGQPIKFLGMGEGLDKLEPFRAEGLASRILGMGDVVGLMRDFEEVVDQKKAEADTRKLLRGTFTLDDFLGQLRAIKKMGSVKDLIDRLPMGGAPPGAELDEGALVGIEAMIQSMTPQERARPQLIAEQPRRALRIGQGAGRPKKEVEQLVERFAAMQQMMGALGQQPGLMGKIPGMRQLAGLKKMRGLAKRAAAGGGLPDMPGLPSMGAGMDSGLGGLGQLPAGAGQMPGGLGGFDMGQPAGGKPAVQSAKDRQKMRNKRKSERQARKRSRR